MGGRVEIREGGERSSKHGKNFETLETMIKRNGRKRREQNQIHFELVRWGDLLAAKTKIGERGVVAYLDNEKLRDGEAKAT